MTPIPADNPPNLDPKTPASSSRRRRRPFRLLLTSLRVILTRLRFLAIFAVVFAIIGGWETISVHWAKWTASAVPREAISSDTEFFCPMDPGVLSDWPSKCPICHMTLVRRKRGDASPLPDGVIARMQFTPYRLYLGGIGVTAIDYRPLAREFEVPGRFVAVPGKVEMWVEAAAFPREIAWLEPGQAAEIQPTRVPGSPTLKGTLLDVPEIPGDASGTLALRLRVEGSADSARPGDPVLVRFQCPAERLRPFRDLPSQPPPLQKGEPRKTYHCMNHPDRLQVKPGACPLDQIPLMAQSLLDNQRVRWWCPMHPEVTADQPGASCQPCGGMILVPRVISYRLPGTVLAVPASAVIDDGKKAVAYVETGAGMFDARLLTLGPRCGDGFPVIHGLEPGNRVVTQGSFLIDAETRLNPSLASSYFGAGTGASGREAATTTGTRKTTEDDWTQGLAEADRPLALKQKTCPVTGKNLGSMGVPARVEIQGKIVFLCCDGCTAAVEANPQRYLASPKTPGEERRP